MIGRMTSLLEKITNITNKVANSDFSQKINIKRRDEIGIMIDAFNDMIDRLNASYFAINQVNKQLEKKIGELTKTRVELSQKQRLALVGEAISKISHEIQNKIGGISIWVQNLAMYNQNDETIQLYIQEMQNAIKSFMDMLINFKQFYREPKLNKTQLNIEDLVSVSVNKCLLEFDSKQINLIKKITHSSIFADGEQLEQVLINILLNAIYYSPQEATIEISTKTVRNDIVLTISDQGPGIQTEDKEKLFQPFYTTKSSGSGLGLSIARNIIKAHHGKVDFYNNANGGTSFEIYLPINT